MSAAENDSQQSTLEAAAGALTKPLLRGWLHLGTAPLAFAGGIVLLALAPDTRTRVVAVIFTLCTTTLFAVSAAYHRGRWTPRNRAIMKRLDHSSIFLLIAGSYTPYAFLLLDPGPARTLLLLVWSGAVLGILFRVFWVDAPRWLYTPIYVVLGWTAVWFMPGLLRGGGWLIVVLLAIGGLLYSGGAVLYAVKWPNPVPRWFGFHEIFHACTVFAFAAHYAGVFLIITGATPATGG